MSVRWVPGHRENIEDRRFDPPAVRDVADGVDGRIASGVLAMTLTEADVEVAALCERIGYGRVMQIAAEAWAKKDHNGALTIGQPRCLQPKEIA